MPRRLRLSMLPAALFLLCTSLFGCEAPLDAPAALTLQTKSAAEVLPAGARYVGMMDVQAMQQNTAINPFEHEEFGGELAAQVEDLLASTGFDPRTDVQQVFVAATENGPDARPSLVVYATYDRDRLQSYVESRFADRLERSDYKGVTVYAAREGDQSISFALATDEMVVASPDAAEVRAMIDRLGGNGRALRDDTATMAQIKTVAGGSSAWFIARGIGNDLSHAREDGHPGDHDGSQKGFAQLGKAVEDVGVRVTVRPDGADGMFVLQPRSGVDAEDVADLARGVIAAMKAGTEKNSEQLQALDQVSVRRRGDVVHVTFAVDNTALRDE